MSYVLTISYNRTVFDSNTLKEIYEEIRGNFNLPKSESKSVVNELETHTGIIIQSGYGKYEFAHKSIQEYLAAEYIVKLPGFPTHNKLINFPSEIALATAISSNPTIYFSSFIFNYLLNSMEKLNFSIF